jgi:hypothetical protein
MRSLTLVPAVLLALAGCSAESSPCLDCIDGAIDGQDSGPGQDDGGLAQDDSGPSSDQGDSDLKRCGGIMGLVCDKGSWCDYPRNDCGGADDMGVCPARPASCPRLFQPVCACDGAVYDNECLAQQAGLDVDDQGACKPPANMFACGALFCALADEYCRRTISDVAGFPDDWACLALPAACGAAPTCACLTREPCGQDCQETGGGLRLTCPGG